MLSRELLDQKQGTTAGLKRLEKRKRESEKKKKKESEKPKVLGHLLIQKLSQNAHAQAKMLLNAMTVERVACR